MVRKNRPGLQLWLRFGAFCTVGAVSESVELCRFSVGRGDNERAARLDVSYPKEVFSQIAN